MNRSSPGVSPLRQRMLEDMHLRKLEPKTQTCYVRAVRRLAEFLGRSPDTATAEELRLFQLHLVDQGVSVRRLHLDGVATHDQDAGRRAARRPTATE